MATKDLEPLDEQKAQEQAGDLLLTATTITVTDAKTWKEARIVRREAKLINAHADKVFKKEKEPHQEIIREIAAREREIKDPTQRILDSIDPKILAYEEEEWRQRGELQKKLDADSRKQAEQMREALVQDMIKAGRSPREIEEFKAQPLFVPPVILPDFDDWLPGEGRNESWGIDEDRIDIKALCQAVIDDRIPVTAVKPNLSVLHDLGNAARQSAPVPGCIVKRFVTITQRQ